MRLILSSNKNENYIPYWPYVAAAWNKLFNITPTLAFVDNDVSDINEYRKHGEVIHIKPIDNIPIGNQAKIARLFLAAQYNELCVINDIDLLPLQDKYLNDLLSQKPINHLLCVGGDVYNGTNDKGKFPMGYLSGESSIFKSFVNTDNFSEFVKKFIGLKVFDNKEDITNAIPVGHADCFSDESALRVLLHENKTKVFNVNRGWENYTDRAICRANWRWTKEELNNNKFIECHMPHPFSYEKIKPLLDWLNI